MCKECGEERKGGKGGFDDKEIMAVLVWGCCKRLVKKHHKHKQGVKTRTIELRLAPSSLHDDALHFHIPGKEDSQEAFERSHQALGRIQQKLFECLGQREARGLQ